MSQGVPAMQQIQDLTSPDELAGFAGAPFSEETIRAAAQQVRRVCGWHIAPEITQTIRLDSDGGRVLHLPSLFVTDVSSVRDLSGREPRELNGWRWSQAGMVEGVRFPSGFRTVEVTFTHGYDSCPDDLLPIIASRTQRRAMQESLGSRSVSYSAEGDRALEDSLVRYVLGALA